jgi:exosortase A-associated hydrolase 2
MPSEAFFLPADKGYRFCLFTPAVGRVEKAALIYLHPFAEELNKTRRMVALQVRALAESGYSVLQIDLFGCGDSSGDFGDATWEAWSDDVALAFQHLRQRTGAPIWLWGLRAGCLIAGATASSLPEKVNLLFWQPVLSGKVLLQQFLRLGQAGALMDEAGAKGTGARLSAELAAGRSIEIAGYRLSSTLAEGLEKAVLVPASGEALTLIWIELVRREMPEISSATAAQLASWASGGHRVEYQSVIGPAFWQTTEIETAPALLERTLAMLEKSA